MIDRYRQEHDRSLSLRRLGAEPLSGLYARVYRRSRRPQITESVQAVTAVGAITPDQDPWYKLSRDLIEAAINNA